MYRALVGIKSGHPIHQFRDNLKFGSLFTFRFLFLPRYFKYFDSFKAPERPPVQFDTYIPLDPYEGDDDID